MTWRSADGRKQGSTTAWRKTRRAVLIRDQHACQIKGPKCTGYATQVHHKVGRGISEAITDLEAACLKCNTWIGDPSQSDAHVTTRTKW